MLSMIISSSAAMEPFALGQGRMNSAINLDIGSERSSITPYFGSSGFAAPNAPQPMELDPGTMVSQTGRLRDQSQAFRDQSAAIHSSTADLLNQTTAVAGDVKTTGNKVEELKRQADLSAGSSQQSALMAGDILNRTRNVYTDTRKVYNDTRDVYNITKTVYNETMISAGNITMLAGMSNIDGKDAAKYRGTSANDVESLQREISNLSRRLDVLERTINKLESGTPNK
jgi:hypothetical protein